VVTVITVTKCTNSEKAVSFRPPASERPVKGSGVKSVLIQENTQSQNGTISGRKFRKL